MEKYDRNLVAATLKAMPVIAKVQAAREKDHHKQRMIVRVKETRKDALRELENNIELVRPLVVREALEKKNVVAAMEDAKPEGMMETND